MREAALAIVAKEPRPGHVKTRLARALGPGGEILSAQLYRAFLEDLHRRTDALPYARYWAAPPGDDLSAYLSVTTISSDSADLAGTLNNVFLQLTRRGYDRIVVISSDSPQLPPAWIRQAFAALDRCDVVLGPTEDGGYYLVGQRVPHDLFTPVTMSTGQVLAQTLQLCRERGLTTELLSTTFDVDEPADVARLAAWLCEAGEGVLPATAEILRDWPAIGVLATDGND